MVEAGGLGVNISLESGSDRMQKVMRKYLDLDKFYKNARYITEKYPHIALGLNAMHGFPTETEEEAMMTLNFIKSLKWVHFPYLLTVRAFPNTDLEKFAREKGISDEKIKRSHDISYEDVAESLTFSQDFTKAVKTMFLRDYVLNKERLLSVLPYQMENFCEDELNQKYNSYFPTKIRTLDDLLKLANIKRSDLKKEECIDERKLKVPNLNMKIEKKFSKIKKNHDALRILLINLSGYFSENSDSQERVLMEPPLGLIALLSYLNREYNEKIYGKIVKSRLDFDSYSEITKIINDFKPDIIGISVMTFYKKFVHRVVDFIREQGIETPIFLGGPYPTGDYENALKNENIDICMLGEGEKTLSDLINRMINNGNKMPTYDSLKLMPGISFSMNKLERYTLVSKHVNIKMES